MFLDVRPFAGDGWLALCVEPEALDMIRRATGRKTRPVAPQTMESMAQDGDTRDIEMVSGGRRAGVGRTRTQTSFEIVKAA